MKKKIFAFAVAALALVSVASAQTTTCSENAACAKNNCPTVKERCVGDKGERCDRDRKCNPFEGLNLSAEQQTKLRAISCPRVVLKEAREKGIGKDVNPREYVRTVRADYLKQIKSVLSSDQYKQFLENYYINQAPAKAKAGKNFKGQKSNGKKYKGHKVDCAKQQCQKDRAGKSEK